MAIDKNSIISQLREGSEHNSARIFNEFVRHFAIDEDLLIDFHKHGNYSVEEIAKYSKNLITCCTENRLCNDSIESIFCHAYVNGVLDCFKTLEINGLLRGMSS